MNNYFDNYYYIDYHLDMETKRLIIRTLTNKDAYDIFKHIYHDRKVQETFLANYVDNFEDFNFERILDYFEKNRSFYYGIELKDTHECIGMIFENDRINEDIEIGYAIGSNHWNKGYVSEALEVVIEELKQREDCKRIFAGAFSDNIASLRVMEKCGMKFAYVIEKELEWQGKMYDVTYYEIIKEI